MFLINLYTFIFIQKINLLININISRTEPELRESKEDERQQRPTTPIIRIPPPYEVTYTIVNIICKFNNESSESFLQCALLHFVVMYSCS